MWRDHRERVETRACTVTVFLRPVLTICSPWWARHETPVLASQMSIIHIDDELLVIDKPCSLPVSPECCAIATVCPLHPPKSPHTDRLVPRSRPFIAEKRSNSRGPRERYESAETSLCYALRSRMSCEVRDRSRRICAELAEENSASETHSQLGPSSV